MLLTNWDTLYPTGGLTFPLDESDTQRHTTEYYDTASGSFVEGAKLPDNYGLFCAANLEEAMIVGGFFLSTGWISFYSFDWESQTWAEMPENGTPRWQAGCEIIETEKGKELWVMGGWRGQKIDVDVVEIFKLNRRLWFTGTALPGPMSHFATIVVNNQILVLGGWNGNDTLSSILVWDSTSWEELEGGLAGPRQSFAAVHIDERAGDICY